MAKRYRSPYKIYRTLGIDKNVYAKAKEINHERSLAQALNQMMRNGIKNKKVIPHNQQVKFLEGINLLTEIVSELVSMYAGACNNLNQIAYKVNLVSLDVHEYLNVTEEAKKKHVQPAYETSKQCLKDASELKKIKKDITFLEGEIEKIWLQLKSN